MNLFLAHCPRLYCDAPLGLKNAAALESSNNMDALIKQSELADIYEKVYAGSRITDEDAMRLYASRDLNAIGAISNVVRERKNGNHAFYILNRHLN